MSTRPLSADEREEIANLAVECEDQQRLQALLAEYLRLRAFASHCRRHASSLPRGVIFALQNNVPRQNSAAAWAVASGEGRIEDDPLRAHTTPRLI